MIVVYCDICDSMIGKENEAEPFHVKLWKGNIICGYDEICPSCAAKIRNYIDDLPAFLYKEGAEE